MRSAHGWHTRSRVAACGAPSYIHPRCSERFPPPFALVCCSLLARGLPLELRPRSPLERGRIFFALSVQRQRLASDSVAIRIVIPVITRMPHNCRRQADCTCSRTVRCRHPMPECQSRRPRTIRELESKHSREKDSDRNKIKQFPRHALTAGPPHGLPAVAMGVPKLDYIALLVSSHSLSPDL